MATRLLTTREVAEMLRVSVRTVFSLIDRGELVSDRPPGCRKHLFRETRVEAYLRAANK